MGPDQSTLAQLNINVSAGRSRMTPRDVCIGILFHSDLLLNNICDDSILVKGLTVPGWFWPCSRLHIASQHGRKTTLTSDKTSFKSFLILVNKLHVH